MTDETMRRFGSARTIAATPLAVAILALTCAMPAEAGLLQKGGKIWAQDKLKSHLTPDVGSASQNLNGRLLDLFRKASVSDGPDWEAVKEAGGRISEDALPFLKPVLNLGEAVINAPENLKDMLKSAKRKIGSVVGRTVDPRAALAFGKGERRWYESSGVLAKELPVAGVSGARIAPVPQAKADPWAAAPAAGAGSGSAWAPEGATGTDWSVSGDGWSGWDRSDERYDDDDREDARVGVFAWRCWGAEAVARGNPLYHVMKRRMYAGECPNEAADGRAGAGGGGARDGYAAALADALGEDTAATAGDHQAALGALETREAERREAERLEKERLGGGARGGRTAGGGATGTAEGRAAPAEGGGRARGIRADAPGSRVRPVPARAVREHDAANLGGVGAPVQGYGESQPDGTRRNKPRFSCSGSSCGDGDGTGFFRNK